MPKTQETEYAFVYKKAFAMKLIKMGHEVFATMPNPRRNNFLVWVFVKSEAFKRDFDALIRDGERND